jgi:hypothetical protein
MASTSLSEVPMDPTTSCIRHRATAAITSVLAAAVVVASLVVVAPTPAGATPPSHDLGADAVREGQAPADPNGAFLFRNGRFIPLGGIRGATATGHVNLNNRGQTVGFYADAQGAVRSFVKDQRGQVATFAVPGAPVTLAAGINDRGQVAGAYSDPGHRGPDPDPGKHPPRLRLEPGSPHPA